MKRKENQKTRYRCIQTKLLKTVSICTILMLIGIGSATAFELSQKEQLGKSLFFDENLSEPTGQACAACHAEDVGFTGPDAEINAHGSVYEGAVQGRFGNRKPPSSAYASFSPIFNFKNSAVGFVGGNFWDGRATGEKLGNPAADQAQGPFLNPLEQNNPSPAAVVEKVCSSTYSNLFKEVWGNSTCSSGNEKEAYDDIALSIAVYEASKEVSQFNSKYDNFVAGKATLTSQEKEGLNLFRGKAKCDRCHPSIGKKALFTDFSYDNLGVPRNPENPFYNETRFNPAGAAFIDSGLADFLGSIDQLDKQRENFGKFKVPTLRNVDKRPRANFIKAYSHNGYFKSIKEIVHFYNTRDVLPVCGFTGSKEGINCWPLPESALNINTKEVGNLGLSDQEEDAIVAFLKTLSDSS